MTAAPTQARTRTQPGAPTASPCTPACAADPRPTVDAATRRRRAVRLAGALAGTALAALRAPAAGARGRRRLLTCAAARVLTAAGVRVEVTSSPVAWPRAGAGRGPGQLVVANSVSWVDHLALLTVVPGVPVTGTGPAGWPVLGGLLRRAGAVPVDPARPRTLPRAVGQVADALRGGTAVTVRPERTTSCGVDLGRFGTAFLQAAVDAAAPVCPVAVRYRVDGGAGTTLAAHLPGEPLRRSLSRVLAARGLVVEVHLLPALDPAGADRRELAALAEYAVAAVTEARTPVVAAHPRRPRVPTPVVPRRRGAASAA
ncbi:lysophospholipid acyltransferase family protein [Modestobacter sp. VKM Ac-2986]|uniref:lysophospholipid acyltransferase family protein n=1 Tax=Modestobacter sp. VKM Ac-2986 TaxID=3004140 RepID=UPI0022AA883A|nr:lysophospholipid acyltransferase family protein [Modestobacter sp. VKM Ac-2986]MCZ2827538.1 lysophospholipid acyltransferase family protein [Modestobacter sp. VKM Ac-2986]